MNKAILVGNLVRDPELRYSQSGIAIANFTVALQRRFAKEGEQGADFVKVLSFNKQAENVAKYLIKGSKVAVDGRIQTGSYENKEGNKVFTFEVVADNVEFLGQPLNNKKGDVIEEAEEEAESVFDGATTTKMSDEIPF